MFKNLIILLTSSILIASCSIGQTQSEGLLSPSDFSAKIEEIPTVQLIDVRTPDEFSSGHIESALNYNWNGSDFQNQISTLDKSQPVFIYCLSGGRSSRAVKKMQSEGFEKIYELNGGMMKWRAANLPETTVSTAIKSTKGMSMTEFKALTTSDKMVLIDFHAEWCIPCKKMSPYLNEISQEMAESLILIQIDADENPQLCKDLKIDAIPVLHLYKDNKLVWENTGYIGKDEVLEQIR